MDVISLPIIISREGKWYVASCPILDIATQGATEDEVKENMKNLIKEYLEDTDTPKPNLENIVTLLINVDEPEEDEIKEIRDYEKRKREGKKREKRYNF